MPLMLMIAWEAVSPFARLVASTISTVGASPSPSAAPSPPPSPPVRRFDTGSSRVPLDRDLLRLSTGLRLRFGGLRLRFGGDLLSLRGGLPLRLRPRCRRL